MNSVNLVGRIGRDPEVRFSQSGMAVCNLSMATSKKIKGEDQTQWHRLVAFGKTAELIEKYISKGDQLGVEGEIKYDNYDKDGTTVYTTDIIVNRIHFISSKQSSGQGQQKQQPGGYQPNRQQQTPDDGGIPF